MEYYNDFVVDTSALRENLEYIRSKVRGDTKLCAIVKADCYGLNSDIVCPAIVDLVDYFAVANVSEAIKIRGVVGAKPILVLGVVPFSLLEECVKNKIEISVSSVSYLERLLRQNILGELNVHIQINTGLNRFGIANSETLEECINITKRHHGELRLNVVGAYSHFATKANDIMFIEEQHDKFVQIVQDCDIPILHIANSFACLNCPNTHHDMVRVGFAMYNTPNTVCSIMSKIVNITHVKKGETVGYDRNFIAEKDMDVAVVPLGYADGFDRRLSNNFSVYVCGKHCRVIGNVCMDVFMIDVTGVDAGFLSSVEVLGNNVTYDMYANALGTSAYEIMLKFRYERMNLIAIK